MTVTILYNTLSRKHDPPHQLYHPENSRRIDIVLRGLEKEGLANNIKTVDIIDHNYYSYRDKIHSSEYVMLIKKMSDSEEGFIDSDTYVNRYTFDVATHVLGSAVYALKLALDIRSSMVFALSRPPGHHAGLAGRALGAPTQGFCIFNNVAAAALYAIEVGYKPVAIIDVDVHHGNGTQEIFWNNPDVIHIDVHEHGIYPGTGNIGDLGESEGYGTKINIPLYSYSNDQDYIYVFQRIVIPIVYNTKPRAMILSAGFDAYMDDGLASMELTETFYKYLGSIMKLINKELGIGIAAVLEGGYSIGLEKGLPAFLKGFINPIDIATIDRDIEPSEKTKRVVKKLYEVLRIMYML